MAENSFSHQLLVLLCSCREGPTLLADIWACLERLRKLETHAPENPAARSAGPRQNGASPHPRKESASGEPNTSEWDVHLRFSPAVPTCPCSRISGQDAAGRPEFPASRACRP